MAKIPLPETTRTGHQRNTHHRQRNITTDTSIIPKLQRNGHGATYNRSSSTRYSPIKPRPVASPPQSALEKKTHHRSTENSRPVKKNQTSSETKPARRDRNPARVTPHRRPKQPGTHPTTLGRQSSLARRNRRLRYNPEIDLWE